ncbi:substrate-binding domain-containing protein, partial [Quadrisphaera sp. KR29]|uniref:substrate-binding domain-containing protein n=1 Tax=Quadrisphaera sp. KR29 TaxID=3461391 RepID=UPI0040451857
RGWQAELRAHGIEPGRLEHGDWSGGSGYEIGREMVAQGLPGAVFIASDLMALGFIRAVHEAGLSVPGDVSVVSFDDNEFAPQVHPPLTTVRQSFGVVGSRCMEILLALIAGHDVDTTPAVPELVVRQSARRV